MPDIKEILENVAPSAIDAVMDTVLPVGFSHLLNRSDYNKANEYNSPKHMMGLYREAGISPAAAAQALTGSQGITANVSSPATNVGSGPGPLGTHIMLQQLKNDQDKTAAQVERDKASAAASLAEAERTRQMTPHEVGRADWAAKEAEERYNLSRNQAEAVRLSNEQFEELAPIEQMKAAGEVLRLLNDIKKGKAEASIAEMKANFAKTYHADPDAKWLNMLIQGVGSGDDNMVKAVVSSFKAILGESFNQLDKSVQEMFDSILP